MNPQPLPNPEPSRTPGRGGSKRRAPPLDQYVAGLMEPMSTEGLSSTFLCEFLAKEGLGHMPEELLQTQVANVFWSAVFDVARLDENRGSQKVAHSLPFIVSYRQDKNARFDLVAFSLEQ